MVWKYFFSSASAGDHGTMCQLKNLIGRTNVMAKPIHKFNESDDLKKLITTSYILVAALEILQMENLSDSLHISYMEKPEEFWMETAEKRKPVMQAICKRIVESFCFQFNTTPKQSDDSVC